MSRSQSTALVAIYVSLLIPGFAQAGDPSKALVKPRWKVNLSFVREPPLTLTTVSTHQSTTTLWQPITGNTMTNLANPIPQSFERHNVSRPGGILSTSLPTWYSSAKMQAASSVPATGIQTQLIPGPFTTTVQTVQLPGRRLTPVFTFSRR